MDNSHHDLEDLLNSTGYTPSADYEARLKSRLDALVESHPQPSDDIRRVQTLSNKEINQPMSKQSINRIALAVVALALIAITAVFLLPVLNTPFNAAQADPQTPEPTDPPVTPPTEAPTSTDAPSPTPEPTLTASPTPLPTNVAEVQQILVEWGAINDMAFSPDGSRFAVSGAGGAFIWDSSTGHYEELANVYHPHLARASTQIAYSATGLLAIGSTESPIITLVNPADPSIAPIFLEAAALSVNDLAFSADGTRLAALYTPGALGASGEVVSTDNDEVALIWDMTTASQAGTHTSAESQYVAARLAAPNITNDPVENLVPHIAINPDGSIFALGTNNGHVLQFNGDGTELFGPIFGPRFFTQGGPITDLNYTYDGTRLGAVAEGDFGHEFSFSSGKILVWGWYLKRLLVYAPDNIVRATMSDPNTVKIMPLVGRDALNTTTLFTESGAHITALTFSPDSNILAIGLSDGSFMHWDWR